MMLDGPELPPILRTRGVPFIMQLRMALPAVICGLSMGRGIALILDGHFGLRLAAWLAVSLVAWFVARHERETYFAKRMAALKAVFDELERRYHASTRSD